MTSTQQPHSTFSTSQLPDGSRVPRWLQTMRAIVKPYDYLENNTKQYGDIWRAEFAGFPTQIIISNPQAIQEIFTAEATLFESGSANKITRPLLGANSLVLLDGDRHIQQRKLLMPPFHGERMRAYGELILSLADRVSSQWKAGQTFNIHAQMQQISLRVILRAVFGLQEGEQFEQIRTILIEMLDVFNGTFSSAFLFLEFMQKDLGNWSPWGRFIRKREQLDRLLYAEINQRRSQTNAPADDILSLLLSARDDDGQPMNDIELRDELMTMLFAGHETTATALAWAFYWIHRQPEVCEKLMQELSQIDIKTTEPMDIARLPYLSAVCSETLRIYPVVLFTLPRVLTAPWQLMGYDIPAGVILSPCIYLTHHRSDLYPDSKQFKPERFLERQFSPYEYLPFGGGNRRCLGMAFALFEMKLVLASILSQHTLTLDRSQPIVPSRRGLTMAPKGGVPMRVS
jgi:cytochrome P450 family 110